MRVCLINPPWDLKRGSIWTQVKSSMPALGILYIAAYLEREKIDVDIVDFQANLMSWEQIEQKIKTGEYDYYGITSTTPIVYNGYRIADIIKRCHPRSVVVMGGVHPSAMPEEALARPSVDYVVRGEGEEAFLSLVKGVAPEQISGISYKTQTGVAHFGPAGFMKDLDLLPFPAYHKIDFSLYRPAVGAYKRLPAINMATTRGCPGKCTFCNSASVKLRRRSAAHIYAEIEMLSKKYGMREICFYDDTFTVYPENIRELCDRLIGGGIDVTWSCFARTDCVNLEMLRGMKRAGCHQVMYGIEAYNEQILKNIKKTISHEKNRAAIQMTRKAGITARCTFMLGNPGETVATIDETIAYAIDLNPDIALFNITIPYPGTEMYEWAKANNYLISHDWNDYDLSEPVMILPGFTADLLKAKYKEAFRKFYYRPFYVLGQMKRLASPSEIPLLYEGLKSLLRFNRS